MSTIKYKMNEISKDLNIKAADIFALLKDAFNKEETKSFHSVSLNEEEVSFIFDYYIQKYSSDDMKAFFDYCAEVSAKEAEKAAELLVQRPGYSEHGTGLALDFNGVSSDFEHDEAYLWLNEHAAEYGFVLRYPTDKVNLTGIDYEPWHFRYVGRENAEKMNELGYCLEEYIDYLMTEPESSENVSGAQAE